MIPDNKSDKHYFFWFSGVIAVLLISGWFFNIRIALLKKNNVKNLAILNQALPDFNNQSVVQLKREIKNSKANITKLTDIFDPKEKWLKKDYDPSIYFIEETGKINQSLRSKAIDKQVNFTELGFKEKLPSESEALYLLTQLYGLKEIVSLGMDYRINFKSITPLDTEEIEGLPGLRLAKSSMELTCPAGDLIEFILQLNGIIPRPYIEAFSLKSKDSVFEMSLSLRHITIALDWKDRQEFAVLTDTTKITAETKPDFTRILRSSNPFLVQTAKETSSSGQAQPQAQAKAETVKPKPVLRFFYRGKAILRSKEVVVIEDVLNQETVFLGPQEKIDDFILKEFSNDEAVLENLDNGKEIIIKREEK